MKYKVLKIVPGTNTHKSDNGYYCYHHYSWKYCYYCSNEGRSRQSVQVLRIRTKLLEIIEEILKIATKPLIFCSLRF